LDVHQPFDQWEGHVVQCDDNYIHTDLADTRPPVAVLRIRIRVLGLGLGLGFLGLGLGLGLGFRMYNWNHDKFFCWIRSGEATCRHAPVTPLTRRTQSTEGSPIAATHISYNRFSFLRNLYKARVITNACGVGRSALLIAKSTRSQGTPLTAASL
jgi:hypothetical protein